MLSNSKRLTCFDFKKQNLKEEEERGGLLINK